MNFSVTLDKEIEIPITVSWETLSDGGSAVPDDDFIPSAGEITFNPGETSKMIGVLIKEMKFLSLMIDLRFSYLIQFHQTRRP